MPLFGFSRRPWSRHLALATALALVLFAATWLTLHVFPQDSVVQAAALTEVQGVVEVLPAGQFNPIRAGRGNAALPSPIGTAFGQQLLAPPSSGAVYPVGGILGGC